MRTLRHPDPKLQYAGQQWKRDKARMLIAETRKRKAVQSIIKEELLLIEQHKRTCALIVNEERRMIAEGYSRDQINEGIMSFLGKIPGGYVSYLKQYFIEMLMNRLNMDPRRGILAYALKNVLEEMEWTKISQYFGKGGCAPLVDLLVRGVSEGVAEIGLDKLAETLFGKPSALQGFMSGTGREMLTDMVHNLMEGFRGQIEEYICNQKWADMAGGLGDMFKGGAEGAIEGGTPGASAAVDAARGLGGTGVSSAQLRPGAPPATAQ
jgi:hypothetical protein